MTPLPLLVVLALTSAGPGADAPDDTPPATVQVPVKIDTDPSGAACLMYGVGALEAPTPTIAMVWMDHKPQFILCKIMHNGKIVMGKALVRPTPLGTYEDVLIKLEPVDPY